MSHRIPAINSMTERMARGIAGRKFAHSEAMVNEMHALSKAAEALVSVHKNPDPYQTQAHNDKKVATASAKLAQRVDAALAKINSIAQSGLTEIDSRIASKTKLKPGPHDQEIRQIFRSKSTTQQIDFLKDSVEAGDSESLSALLMAPRSVTGLNAEMSQRFKDAFELKQAPAEFEERSTLLKDISSGVAVIEVARQLTTELLDPAALRAAQIAEKHSAEAQASFESSVNAT